MQTRRPSRAVLGILIGGMVVCPVAMAQGQRPGGPGGPGGQDGPGGPGARPDFGLMLMMGAVDQVADDHLTMTMRVFNRRGGDGAQQQPQTVTRRIELTGASRFLTTVESSADKLQVGALVMAAGRGNICQAVASYLPAEGEDRGLAEQVAAGLRMQVTRDAVGQNRDERPTVLAGEAISVNPLVLRITLEDETTKDVTIPLQEETKFSALVPAERDEFQRGKLIRIIPVEGQQPQRGGEEAPKTTAHAVLLMGDIPQIGGPGGQRGGRGGQAPPAQ